MQQQAAAGGAPQGGGQPAAAGGSCSTTAPKSGGAGGVPTKEYGKKGAKVEILALLPITHGCHVQTEAEVVKAQAAHPNDIHLKVVDLFGTEGQQLAQQNGGQRALVLINGKSSFELNGKTSQVRVHRGQVRTGEHRPRRRAGAEDRVAYRQGQIDSRYGRVLASPCRAPVAQWIERLPSKQRVAGSNPAGRASRLQGRCRQ